MWGRYSLLFIAAMPCLSHAVLPGTVNDIDTTDFTSVGKVGSASGVLVGPDLVLTAKHVGVNYFSLPGYGTFNSVGVGVGNPDRDLMLFHIDNRGMALPYTQIWITPVADGAPITMVGYGSSGVLNPAGTGYDLSLPRGVRRKANAFVSRTENATYGGFAPGDSLISILRENGQGALANGDSGGGVFRTVGGQTYLVGTNSFITVWGSWTSANAFQFSSSDVDYFGSGAVSLSHAQTWLTQNGASVVPEPGTSVALAALVGLSARRVRNKR